MNEVEGSKGGEVWLEPIKINARQLFVLIILFEHGSAIVIPLGVSAKQDVWIAILLGLALGLLVFSVYGCLFRCYPDQPLVGYIQHIVGAPLGKLLGIIYVTYFLYIAARVLRDFGELLLTFAYPETPLFVLNAIMALVVMYGAYKGLEVLARTGELFLTVLYVMALAGFVLVFVSGVMDLSQLEPVLEEGWGGCGKPCLRKRCTFRLVR